METIGLVFKMFWAPGEASVQMSKKPRVLATLILLGVTALGTGLVSLAKIDFGAAVIQQIEKNPRANLSEDQKQNFAKLYRTFAPVLVGLGAVFPAIIVAIATVIYFGIFTMIGREGDFKTFFAATALAYAPLMVRQIIACIQIFAIPQEQLDLNALGSLSLQLVLDPLSSSKVLYALAGIVDITSIWIAVLLCISYKSVTKKSVGSGLRATAVIIPYLLVSLVFAGLRMLQS